MIQIQHDPKSFISWGINLTYDSYFLFAPSTLFHSVTEILAQLDPQGDAHCAFLVQCLLDIF